MTEGVRLKEYIWLDSGRGTFNFMLCFQVLTRDFFCGEPASIKVRLQSVRTHDVTAKAPPTFLILGDGDLLRGCHAK